MPITESAEPVRRAARLRARMAAMPIEERLERARASRRALAGVAHEVVDHAVAEARQPRRFAQREVESALDLLDALPQLAEGIRPRTVPAASGNTVLEWAPFGVVLGWHAANSPVWVPTVVCASALVAGNAVVARPSSRVRTTTGLVLDALRSAWPDDALVVVGLAGPDAEPLIWDPGVDAVVAHASTRTCKRHLSGLGRAYARGVRMRPYIPEASGNDPLLVLRGADLGAAATAVAVAGFANGGRLCMAAKRIIVERGVWSDFAPRLRAAVEALRVGDPDDPRTDVGPLPDEASRRWVLGALEEALHRGAEVVAGTAQHGEYFSPTVLLLPDTVLDVALWREESFAPLRGAVLVDGEDEAVEVANSGPYGLGAAVFGGGEEVVHRLHAARVLVDEDPLYQDPHLVVGGVGDSGMAGARPKLEQLVFARRVHRGESD